MGRTIVPGDPAVLGARLERGGVNFALYSAHATAVDLCLYEEHAGLREVARLRLPGRSGDVWHGFVPGLGAGAYYGYRVSGPYCPNDGHRFNPSKVLLDPYARGVLRPSSDNASLLGWVDDPWTEKGLSALDSGDSAPLGRVSEDGAAVEESELPHLPWADTVIYEAHVKGLTMRHPGVPLAHRGKFLGVCAPSVLAHLRSIGVTTIELLPVTQAATEWPLLMRGQSNYWGYAPLNFFSPDLRFATEPKPEVARSEFRQMVQELHRNGFEVILDVVYNHTMEGGEAGPTLSFRGIDNATYYTLQAETPRYPIDVTGCGNSLRADHPAVVRLVMDSLRFWASEMGVDGFRFDLATSLARYEGEFRVNPPLLTAIHQDPTLVRRKLIAEPWDIGPVGYRVGQFPSPWSEWNGMFRDTVRSFWAGHEGQLGDFATRVTGSSDLYGWAHRGPHASINFVTAHDGFTLADLVSFQDKHNAANGEENRDGENHNRSWNCGVEGDTENPDIRALRIQQRKNLLCSLLLSLGVPMILGGDELGHSQRGNNNAYCQDNEISWLSWELDAEGEEFLRFFRELMAIRRASTALRSHEFFRGAANPGSLEADLIWYDRDGREMPPNRWQDPNVRAVASRIAEPTLGSHGGWLVVWNGSEDVLKWRIPQSVSDEPGTGWRVRLDTAVASRTSTTMLSTGDVFTVARRSVVVLQRVGGAAEQS